MSKKLNWDSLQKDIFSPKTRNQSEYGSIKELMKAAHAQDREREALVKHIESMRPAMHQLFIIRAQNQTPVLINRPFQYMTSELIKSDSAEDIGHFQDVMKPIKRGTQLTYTGMEVGTQEIAFRTQDNEEILIHKSQLSQLCESSDIFDVVNNLFNNNQEE